MNLLLSPLISLLKPSYFSIYIEWRLEVIFQKQEIICDLYDLELLSVADLVRFLQLSLLQLIELLHLLVIFA